MDKKKNLESYNKLYKIIKEMTRIKLNKFVSNINKDLKIPNPQKMKREDLEGELLKRSEIIIDMIDKDKDLKLFDTTTKPRIYKITKEQETALFKNINELSQKAIKEKDLGAKKKLTKEASKLSTKLMKSVLKE